MVGTHLPSNLLLAAVALAPTFPVAVVLLLARTSLSNMDVPTRQALVMRVVEPPERTSAAAVTNAARYSVRPLGPLIGGLLQQFALGLPLLVAGVVKGGYDLALWRCRGGCPPGSASDGRPFAKTPTGFDQVPTRSRPAGGPARPGPGPSLRSPGPALAGCGRPRPGGAPALLALNLHPRR